MAVGRAHEPAPPRAGQNRGSVTASKRFCRLRGTPPVTWLQKAPPKNTHFNLLRLCTTTPRGWIPVARRYELTFLEKIWLSRIQRKTEILSVKDIFITILLLDKIFKLTNPKTYKLTNPKTYKLKKPKKQLFQSNNHDPFLFSQTSQHWELLRAILRDR